MQDTVSVPSSPSGADRVMGGSWAARADRASRPKARPGRIMPPRKRPPLSTTDRVVAVPMSKTATGGVYRARAATQSTTRSMPRLAVS